MSSFFKVPTDVDGIVSLINVDHIVNITPQAKKGKYYVALTDKTQIILCLKGYAELLNFIERNEK